MRQRHRFGSGPAAIRRWVNRLERPSNSELLLSVEADLTVGGGLP